MPTTSYNNTYDTSDNAPIPSGDSVSIVQRNLKGRFLQPRAEVPLDIQQRKTAWVLAEKIRSGTYRSCTCVCMGCGHAGFTCIAQRDRYQIPASFVLCDRCGLVTCNPRIDDEARRDFFSKHLSDLLYGGRDEESQFELTKRSRGRVVSEVLKRYQLAKAGDLILDVGCGNGGVVSALIDQGFEAIGIDIHEQSLMYGKNQHQLPLLQGSLQDADCFLKKQPQVILYMFSLEYVENIHQELAAARTLMADDGCLVVVGLRLEKSILSRISLKFSLRFYLVHVFTPETLGRIARAEGLALVRHNMGVGSLFSRPENHTVFIFKKCRPSDQAPGRLHSRWSRLKLGMIEFCGSAISGLRSVIRGCR